jgi:hypothetical protein
MADFSGNLYKGHFELAHRSDLKPGISIAQTEKLIVLPTANTRTFVAPDDPKKSMTVLEFENALQEYEDRGKHWILFDDNKLVAEGLGGSREAELYWNISYYDYLKDNGKLNRVDAERKKYQKMKELYTLTSYENEYFLYRILLVSKLDKKEIDGDNADYLLAQKKSEIDSKLEVARQNAISLQLAQQMVALQRAALFMQAMSSVQQSLQTQQPAFNRVGFSCTTNRMGNFSTTNCY